MAFFNHLPRKFIIFINHQVVVFDTFFTRKKKHYLHHSCLLSAYCVVHDSHRKSYFFPMFTVTFSSELGSLCAAQFFHFIFSVCTLLPHYAFWISMFLCFCDLSIAKKSYDPKQIAFSVSNCLRKMINVTQ